MSSPPSAQRSCSYRLHLRYSPQYPPKMAISIQTLISRPLTLENDRRLFIYYFKRDAADNMSARTETLGGGAAEDEEAEDEVDGAIVNCDILSPPVDQHYNNLEVALQMIQGFTKEHGYALTTLRSKIKDGEVYKVYQQYNSGKFRSPFKVAEQNRQRMNGTKCRNCLFSGTLVHSKGFGAWV
jgi:hypothetical protein